MKVAIIDYNSGNVGSIKNMLKRIGVQSEITNDPEKINAADKLILPGVGHFDYGMIELHKTGLVELLTDKVVRQKTPFLGICLGVQLLTESSEEGQQKGLGWIKGVTRRFDLEEGSNKKLPHMGWAEVNLKKDSRLFKNMHECPRFYFVHTFHLAPEHSEDSMLTAHYGYEFVAGLERENILGVQFHPEKSHKFGMRLLENFINEY